MSKRKAEGILERVITCEGEPTEVGLEATASTHQIVSLQVETPVEGGTRETPATPAAAPAQHVDDAGTNLLWILLEDVGYTVW